MGPSLILSSSYFPVLSAQPSVLTLARLLKLLSYMLQNFYSSIIPYFHPCTLPFFILTVSYSPFLPSSHPGSCYPPVFPSPRLPIFRSSCLSIIDFSRLSFDSRNSQKIALKGFLSMVHMTTTATPVTPVYLILTFQAFTIIWGLLFLLHFFVKFFPTVYYHHP